MARKDFFLKYCEFGVGSEQGIYGEGRDRTGESLPRGYRTEKKPAYVFMDGPFADQDHEGNEIPTWGVSTMTEQDDEIKTWTAYSYQSAKSWADKLGAQYGIPVQIDGTEAH